MNISVIGGGIFGTTASLALRARGHEVRLYEAATIPRPEAASTDLSKLVRMDYGRDTFYQQLGQDAILGWERWNQQSPRPLYHGDGILVLAAGWDEGGFERDSYESLVAAGHTLERWETVPLSAWRWPGPGYLNPKGGWVESGAVVAWLQQRAREEGVTVIEQHPRRGLPEDADVVVVAAGAWTPALVPELSSLVRLVAQPTLYVRPPDPERWRPPHFLPFACAIATTGWYGFPAQRDGLVKIANHGPGVPLPATASRELGPEWDDRLHTFLRAHLPELASAPIVQRRLCLYTDVFDGNFIIDRLPGQPRVVLATGVSGHAFKFAPLLGELTADRVEGRDNPRLARFSWRSPGPVRPEQARAR
jgi:glycine/D-amino acid oxidase-like deaminating enzyme